MSLVRKAGGAAAGRVDARNYSLLTILYFLHFITKYYMAGAQVVAVRVGSTLSYLLSDHLGSTSLTVNTSGTKTAEMRYTAWGEVRYQSGTTPTDQTYTGQRSYAEDFGLMYYNARWYDTSLGRFAQADTVVPPGPQGYDRYAYVNNNPLRYNDPSGHTPCDQIPEGSARDACNNSKYGDYQKQLDMQKQWKEGADVCFGATGANPGTCTQGGSSDELAGLPYALAIIALPYLPLAGLAAAEFYIAAQAAKAAASALAAANAACRGDACASEVQSQLTVLGRWPVNEAVAKTVGGKFLNIPMDQWNALSRAGQWELNKQWLDKAIARGDTFYLASKFADAAPGTFYHQELHYLFSRGYTISTYQNYLIPPIP